MYRQTIAILLCFFVTLFLSAQSNVLVTGILESAVQGKEIGLTVNEKYLNGELIVYTSDITSDGYFAFQIMINEPELVSLSYGGKRP